MQNGQTQNGQIQNRQVQSRPVQSRQAKSRQSGTPQQVFIPFSEALMERAGFPIGELVPFKIEYQCIRLLADGKEEIILDQSDACIATNS